MSSEQDICLKSSNQIILSKDFLGDEVFRWMNMVTPDKMRLILYNAYDTYKLYNTTSSSSSAVSNWSATSVLKGQEGENAIFKILEGKFSVLNTSKIPRSGDFKIHLGGNTYTVEVKNYKNTIPYAEIEKFRRDIMANRYDGGIFVSIGSKIIGIDEKFSIRREYIGGFAIPIIYMILDSVENHELVVKSVDIIHYLSKTYEELETCVISQEEVRDNIIKLKNIFEVGCRNRSEFFDRVSDVNKILIKHYDNLINNELLTKQCINDISKAVNNTNEVGSTLENINSLIIKYSIKEAKAFTVILEIIYKRYPDGSWKETQNKIIHNIGYYIIFRNGDTIINFDAKKIDRAFLLKIYSESPDDISIGRELSININENTINCINFIINTF